MAAETSLKSTSVSENNHQYTFKLDSEVSSQEAPKSQMHLKPCLHFFFFFLKTDSLL